MGLFDKLKGKKSTSKTAESVSDAEKKYYQRDEYYEKTAFSGTSFESEVITFDERKKTSYPSKGGLYVAEILLLHYCEKGNYPHPASGYPGFWWFGYGIRDVTAMLKQLEDRGFIYFKSPTASLNQLKVPELKSLLIEKECFVTGKKADLIMRVSENYSDEELLSKGIEPKYALTPLGEQELRDNEYVPFLHSFKYTTSEGYPEAFNVWTINRLFKGTETDNWRDAIVDEYNRVHRGTSLNDPYVQARAPMLRAEVEYEVKGDLNKYISFWEDFWSKGKPDFDIEAFWLFRLSDLYIEAERYDDATAFLKKVNQLYQGRYEEAANQLIHRIEKGKR